MPVLSPASKTALTKQIDRLGGVKKRTKKVLKMGVALEGKLIWAPVSHLNQWTKRSTGHADHLAISMVCWLAPLYIAFQAGVASRSMVNRYDALQLSTFGKGDAMPGGMQAISQAAAGAFYREAMATPLVGGVAQPGQILFFYEGANATMKHMALALGGTQTISLWSEPDANRHLQVCTIAQLDAAVTAGHHLAPGSVIVRAYSAPWEWT